MAQPPPLPSPNERLVSLHLVASYPVRWSRFAVLRDFLQNFYDAVGRMGFASRVYMESAGNCLDLALQHPGFELDWLTHIGASTKTSAQPGTHAGYFGEGFKIAALCAVRDFRWTVSMGSQQWSESTDVRHELASCPRP